MHGISIEHKASRELNKNLRTHAAAIIQSALSLARLLARALRLSALCIIRLTLMRRASKSRAVAAALVNYRNVQASKTRSSKLTPAPPPA